MPELSVERFFALLLALAGTFTGATFLAMPWRIGLSIGATVAVSIFFAALGGDINRVYKKAQHAIARKSLLVRLLIAGSAMLLFFGAFATASTLATKSLSKTIPAIAAPTEEGIDPTSDDPSTAQLDWHDGDGIGLALVMYDGNGLHKAKIAIRNMRTEPISTAASQYGSSLYLLIRHSEPINAAALTDNMRLVDYQGEQVIAVRSYPDGWLSPTRPEVWAVDWPINSVAPGQTYYDPSKGKGIQVFDGGPEGTNEYPGVAYIEALTNKVQVLAPITGSNYRPATEF